MTLLGAILCFLPLFDLLGYESSAAIGAVGGFVCAILTARALAPYPRGPLQQARMPTLFVTLALQHSVLLLPPLLLLLLNMLRVQNCDPLTGILFFALIAPVALLIGQTSAWCVAGMRVEKTWKRAALASLFLLGNGLALGWHIASQPPITGHQWLIGYMSGSIYDEALSIPPSLLWYRVANLCAIFAIVWGFEAARRRTCGAPTRRFLTLAITMALLWTGMTAAEQQFGIRVTRETISETLAGEIETEHFIITYPLQEPYVTQLEQLVDDHEYRYAEMKAFFGTDPVALHGRKVRSFVYPDTETKGALMGARRTLIAKIWLREIHITWRGFGDHLLAHELAHVFTEPFGAGPLKLSMQNGVGVNMGLVEGIATAADWPASEIPPHTASAAMRRLSIAPDIRGLVGAGGFWTQSSGRAYTLMGSFVKFLVDTYGIEPFKKAYRDGDFEAAYHKSASALVSEWEVYVDAIEVSEDQMELARYYYERPSIFGKVCARTIGELRRQARLARAAGDMTRALAMHDAILGFDPRNVSYQLAHTEALVDSGQLAAASKRLDELLQGDALVPQERVALEHLRADVYWRLGELDLAAKSYAECEAQGVPESTRRQLQVKRAILSGSSDTARELGKTYFLEQPAAATALYYPLRWMMEAPDDALAAYLAARRLWSVEMHQEALSLMPEDATALPSEELREELAFMRATASYHTGELDEAAKLFEGLASSRSIRLRITAREWLARVKWRRGE
ncbi:unnamed protein product [Laminaria digitata]